MSAGPAWARAGLLAAFVLAADQATKALVRHDLAVGEDRGLLTHVRNKGVAFSVLENQAAIVIAVIAVAVTALLVFFARNASRPLIWLPTGMLAGGAIGNVFDRVRDGAVTDFIKLPSWPAFNVADIAITLGVVALVLVLERRDAPDGGA